MVMTVEQIVERMIGKGNRSTRRKRATVPLCSPQIPHGLTQARTRTAATDHGMACFMASEDGGSMVLKTSVALHGQQGATSLKTEVFIVTVMRTKNPTKPMSFGYQAP
jgi:hypothetical protein